MSHDCCKKCGIREPEVYKEISIVCDKIDCPQKLRNEVRDKFLSLFTTKSFKDLNNELFK